MEKIEDLRIKIGDKIYKFNTPTVVSQEEFIQINEWCEFLRHQKALLWTSIPGLPNYIFKAFRIVSTWDKPVKITFECDNYAILYNEDLKHPLHNTLVKMKNMKGYLERCINDVEQYINKNK